MTLNMEKFPKAYDVDADLWKDEGEWRKFMRCVYTGREVRNR